MRPSVNVLVRERAPRPEVSIRDSHATMNGVVEETNLSKLFSNSARPGKESNHYPAQLMSERGHEISPDAQVLSLLNSYQTP